MSQPPNTPNYPKRMTVGDLVRHKHLPERPPGLVIEHFMWDAYAGGLHVKFIKPYTDSVGSVLDGMSDRYDSWEILD